MSFNNSLFTKGAIQAQYRTDPTKFVRNVLEGLADGTIPPESFSIRALAGALLSEDWVDGGCRAPYGARGVPFDQKAPKPIYEGGGADGKERGSGGEFEDNSPPNEFATRGFMRHGKANIPLLEAFEDSRKHLTRTAILESGMVRHSDFVNITGQILFTAIMKPYTMEEFKFTKMVPTRQTDIGDIEKVGGTTGIGNVFDEAIKEGDGFPTFGVTENFRHTGPKLKRGGIVRVTKEAVKFNRTGDLLQQCGTIGKGLGCYTENAAIDAIVDEGTGAKSALSGGHRYHWKNTAYASYQTTSPWVNVATSNGLVDHTDLDAGRQVFLAMRDPFTNEEIEIMPKQLLVHYSNELTARRIVGAMQVRSGDITTGTGIQTLAPNIILEMMKGLTVETSRRFSNRITTSTDWWLTDINEAIERPYVWDMTPEQFGGGTHDDIYNDVVQIIKVSKCDCYSVKEPRALEENRQ